jgi:hypothetical protein
MKAGILWCKCILITLFSVTYFAMGQTYTTMISSPEDDSPLSLIADHSNGSYLVTWRGSFDPNATDPVHYFESYRNIIFHVDEQTEITDSIEVDILGGYDWELWDLHLFGDSLLAWGTAYNEANESCHLGLLWLNEDLDVLDYQIHGNYSDSAQFINFTTDNLGNMIFAGFHNWTNELYLIKTDPGGEFIMDNSIPMWGAPWPNIGYLPATDQLICGSINWVGIINNSDFMPDTLCQPDIFIGGFEGVGWWVGYDEYSAILPGMYLKGPPEYGWNFSCVIFDSNAQVRDSIVFPASYDQNYAMDVDFITVDSIFFGGLENYICTNGSYVFDPVDRYYYISMFNFNGDKFWTLHLGGDANYSLMCLTALKNNDCLVAGARYDWRNNTNLERDIMLFKIEANGMLVSTPEKLEAGFKIFPNPASDHVKVQFENPISLLNLYDVYGNLIYSKNCKNLNDLTIDVSTFTPGIYVLMAQIETGQIISRKIIIS